MDKDVLNTVATDAFLQAEEGYAVELDPDVATALGAFSEEEQTILDFLDDMSSEAESGEGA